MAKRISIVVIILSLVFGGIAIWYKTRPVEEKTEVLGKNISIAMETSKPLQSFDDQVTQTASSAASLYSMEINTKKAYEAIIRTSVGDITVALSASATPITVNNFVALARKNFYDNTIFHRVIKGFMIQGGDPNGTGSGGPGYQFDDEPFTGEYSRGTVAMANAGPNTNGSQFFIMHADYPLPKNYVIFGKVTSGIEVVDTIATAGTKPGGEGSTPIDPVVVLSVKIVEQ
ncbi:MAG: peptidylprolyl isomerase [Candidatus Gottesmanbacteria bacterium]